MSKARGLADLGNVYSDGALSSRNVILNGAMNVSQRGVSFTGLTAGTTKYTLDRWKFDFGGSPTGVLTITQDTDTPTGFGSSLKVDCTTADASLASGALLGLEYRIEGQDLQQLGYGGAGAQQTTISFWVKSNKTGTYAIMVFQPDDNRQEQVQYTIDVADTWEKKTGIITADTTGVIDNDTGAGLKLSFALGAGWSWKSGTAPTAWKSYLKADAYAGQTVNLSDNTANYWNITGVQMEVGDTATPFEHRSYGQELAACQRFYEYGTQYRSGAIVASTAGIETSAFVVSKRAGPTMTAQGTAFINFTGVSVSAGLAQWNHYPTGGSSGAQGRYAINWTADAEL